MESHKRKRSCSPSPTYMPPNKKNNNIDRLFNTYKCHDCEKCDFYYEEIIALKQELNDKIYELNKLIESIHNRFNETGDMLSYIR
jgi:hypothetical protein